jgi:hypothetical protein
MIEDIGIIFQQRNLGEIIETLIYVLEFWLELQNG